MGLIYKPVVKPIPDEEEIDGKNLVLANILDITNEDESIEKLRVNVKKSELVRQIEAKLQMEAKHIEAQN